MEPGEGNKRPCVFPLKVGSKVSAEHFNRSAGVFDVFELKFNDHCTGDEDSVGQATWPAPRNPHVQTRIVRHQVDDG